MRGSATYFLSINPVNPVINQESINDYNSAIDLLNSAIEIYDDYGLKSKSDEILFLLEKIGNSEKIIENYKSTGTAFNYNVDDGSRVHKVERRMFCCDGGERQKRG